MGTYEIQNSGIYWQRDDNPPSSTGQTGQTEAEMASAELLKHFKGLTQNAGSGRTPESGNTQEEANPLHKLKQLVDKIKNNPGALDRGDLNGTQMSIEDLLNPDGTLHDGWTVDGNGRPRRINGGVICGPAMLNGDKNVIKDSFGKNKWVEVEKPKYEVQDGKLVQVGSVLVRKPAPGSRITLPIRSWEQSDNTPRHINY